MIKKVLIIRLIKEGFSINQDTRFKIDKNTSCLIRNSTNSSFKTIEINVERTVTIKEYLDGRIGTYKDEIIDWVRRYLQTYSILNANGMTIITNSTEFQSNYTELSDKFRILREKKNLPALLKPTGGVVEAVYKKMQSSKIISSAKDSSKINPEIRLAIDWYNTGLVQLESISQFLHYFIPLEIFVWEYIKKSRMSWKKDNLIKYKEIKSFINRTLNDRVFEKKKSTLFTRLPDYPFIEALEKYFRSIFSNQEIRGFWGKSSDITENGKWIWSQYAKILKFGRKENADLFNVIGRLNTVRNDIVHNGRKEVPSEDIFLMENILRRVIKKELLAKTKSK